jgi:hypothetical protein
LDGYICILFDRYFSHILAKNQKVRFEYNYHLLKRWLLKMSYNSARVNGSIDLFVYPALLPYINGLSLSRGRSAQLFIQLSYPGPIPARERDLLGSEYLDAPDVWEPRDNRVGLAWINIPSRGRKLLRTIHLRSYSFLLGFNAPGATSAEARNFADALLTFVPGTKLLTASSSHLDLSCNGVDAWESYFGARQNTIVVE